jgi:aldose 1-epimerase
MNNVSKKPFGTMPDGTEISLYELTNENGMRVTITDYGATLVDIVVPDRDGNMADVNLGFDTLEPYFTKSPYFGCTVGRFGNRIANASFDLDGKTCNLAANNGTLALHGGVKGFDKYVWNAEILEGIAPAIRFTMQSPDGDQGFPGNLDVAVIFALTSDNAILMNYEASTDAPTVVNLTNHAYFNLKGEGNGDILAHELYIAAEHFTPINEDLLPIGDVVSVMGTPFDFTAKKPIGRDIELNHDQLQVAGGFDHNFVLIRNGTNLELAARVVEPESGRILEVLTTEPAVQFYAGNFLDGSFPGKSGKPYVRRGGFCLETQHYPDSPNHPEFPTTVLRPGETYKTTTVYRFSAK